MFGNEGEGLLHACISSRILSGCVFYDTPCTGCIRKGNPVVTMPLCVNYCVYEQKVFPLSGKVVFIWEKHFPVYRDLACQQARSRYRRENFSSHMNAV